MNKVVKILSIVGTVLFLILALSTFSIEINTDALESLGMVSQFSGVDMEDTFYSAYGIAMVASIWFDISTQYRSSSIILRTPSSCPRAIFIDLEILSLSAFISS